MAKIKSKYTDKIRIVEKFLSDEQAKEHPDSKKIEDYTRRIKSFNKAMLVTDPQSPPGLGEIKEDFIYKTNDHINKGRNVY